MSPRNDATLRQIQAARPDASTWLAANAGSGKTRVLTDRVARLLLSGVQPQHILCLTYTKAAAAEMQNRLFGRLGEWAMLPDDRLRQALDDLGIAGAIDAVRLTMARTLFARAIETPGGLKIQTIHSFCAALLRRFPLEAGVSPQFAEMEDRAAQILREEIVSDLAEDALPGGAALVDRVAAHLTDTDFARLTAGICAARDGFSPPADRNSLSTAFGLAPGCTADAILAQVFLGDEIGLIADLCPVLARSGTNDSKAAARLAAVTAPDMAGLAVLEDVLLTGAGAKAPFTAKIGGFPTKGLREGALADRMDRLENLMRRVEAAREQRLALAAVDKAAALHDFAGAFLPEYTRRKQMRGWLDFDDLILKARQLLNDPAVATWVLYRLDGGIDHILVDEAQDTSPAQWDVVEKLAQEFTSGAGARADVERTIFVVGDKKQSIYSFQGADPEAFDRMQAEFGTRLRATGSGLQEMTLEYSFRSSHAILSLVDAVFDGKVEAGFAAGVVHRAFKSDLPGRVDLWPPIEKVEEEEDGDWTDPVDRPGARHHTVVLAERIATRIAQMIATETLPVDGAGPGQPSRRPVRAGDVLILVQRRSDLFAELIRACKAAGLPIAGADRLKVGAELAVRDLAALLSFLATPEDSLSLATALKSPLFGWSEQALFDLAHRRTRPYLWQALRDRDAEFADTVAVLRDLRNRADYLRPFDLIERVLTRHDGRRRLLARLGAEAEDGINALLSQALAYESTDIPSLTGFLGWMQTGDLEIKRQMGSAGNMIRVMTVHGSKGLEAPIVILPDTASRRPSRDAQILRLPGDLPVWSLPAASAPAALSAASAEARQRQENERQRLLYVALTRAEKWLIVAAAGDLDKNGNSWFQQVQTALQQRGAQPLPCPGGEGLRLSHGDWDAAPLDSAPLPVPDPVVLPPLFRHAAPISPDPEPLLIPSQLGGAKALPGPDGLDEEAAKLRGTRLHRLLEHLPTHPREGWPDRAARLLPDLPGAEIAALLAEVAPVLTAPDLASVFAETALAEVAISADLDGRRLSGVIDRLLFGEDWVLAVDFKSNATTPDRPETCPEALLRQMGAYRAALAQIYPDHRIDTAILWTRTAQLMRLPHDLVSAALARATCLDDTQAPT